MIVTLIRYSIKNIYYIYANCALDPYKLIVLINGSLSAILPGLRYYMIIINEIPRKNILNNHHG
jgi:hypothetical protein